MAIRIRNITPRELLRLLPELADLLVDTVNAGSPLGFLSPLGQAEARDYWQALVPDLERGGRILVAACEHHTIVGAGQLVLSPWPNARHRAEVQKLLVARQRRGRGIGAALVAALHDAARRRGLALLVLNTRRGEPAEALYRRLGYKEVGVIPGWTVGPDGERYEHVTLYHELA